MRQTSLMSACRMHSSMQSWHIAMHASSIDTMTAGVMPDMRSIARSIVLHMSAQFMHAGAQSIICAAHTVQACSQAAQASIHACMRSMSMRVSPPIIDVEPIASIIMRSIPYLALVSRDGAGAPA
ncbi:hypothetical protein FBY40_1814 [Microbacterium sp. SLBN-154]|nr:hypothetical protein FBY40_1814 [Microbacterium sp. SLBN-154]